MHDHAVNEHSKSFCSLLFSMPGASVYITPRSVNLDEDVPARSHSVPMVRERVACYGDGVQWLIGHMTAEPAASIFKLRDPGSGSTILQGTADHPSCGKADC